MYCLIGVPESFWLPGIFSQIFWMSNCLAYLRHVDQQIIFFRVRHLHSKRNALTGTHRNFRDKKSGVFIFIQCHFLCLDSIFFCKSDKLRFFRNPIFYHDICFFLITFVCYRDGINNLRTVNNHMTTFRAAGFIRLQSISHCYRQAFRLLRFCHSIIRRSARHIHHFWQMADFLKHDIISHCEIFLIRQIHTGMYGISISICINFWFIQNSSDTVLDANGICCYFRTLLLHGIFDYYISGSHTFRNLLYLHGIMSCLTLLIFLFIWCFADTQNRTAIHHFYCMFLTLLRCIVSLRNRFILHLLSIQKRRHKLHFIKNFNFIFIRQVFPCLHRKSFFCRL